MTIRILSLDAEDRPLVCLGYGKHHLPAGRHRIKTPDGGVCDVEGDETFLLSVEPGGNLEEGSPYVCGRYVSGIMYGPLRPRLCGRPPHDGPCEVPPLAVPVTPPRWPRDP